MYGQFFDSESYVILYTYIAKNREQYVIYFWQGKKSSIVCISDTCVFLLILL